MKPGEWARRSEAYKMRKRESDRRRKAEKRAAQRLAEGRIGQASAGVPLLDRVEIERRQPHIYEPRVCRVAMVRR